MIAKYSEWLKKSPIPKLLIHATPGLFVTPENAAWAASNFKNMDTLDLGPGIFMLMEDNPHETYDSFCRRFINNELFDTPKIHLPVGLATRAP